MTIIHGDALEEMRKMADGSFQTIVTSPPYNLLNSTGGGIKNPGDRWEACGLREGYEGHGDAMPHDKYVKWQRECLREMWRLLRDDGAIFYNHKWRVQGGVLQDRADIVSCLPVRQIIIWQRAGGINRNPHFFLPTYEVVYLFARPGFRISGNGMMAGDVWHIPQDHFPGHPATFPIELPHRCLKDTGDGPVLDPFLGSGSTAVAAERLGRPWVGIEKSAAYCELARRRVAREGRGGQRRLAEASE